MQDVVNCLDELLGSLSGGGISRHSDDRLLQRAELLKASARISASGDSRLHKPLDKFMR